MADDKKKRGEVHERPLDATRDAQDFFGDTAGLTGITTGNPKDISAEPDEILTDTEHLPGGILPVKNPPKGSLGVQKESYDNRTYTKNTVSEMSSTAAENMDAQASENDNPTSPAPSPIGGGITVEGAQTSSTNENVREHSKRVVGTGNDPLSPAQGEFQGETPPYTAGEQSVSGDMPTPDSDDDTLANAQAVGTQTHEDVEHPKEIDIGRDIDEAEEYRKTH